VATYFISDLHLHPGRPKLVALFKKFLQSLPPDVEALYILGDFFEAWVGDDDPDYHEISALLKNKASNLAIYFMPGNRDFLINKNFTRSLGLELLPDPCLITLYDKKILLAHGDGLCTQDKSYQRYRRIVRFPLLQKLFLCLPLSFRKKVASGLRQNSQEQYQKNPEKRYQEIEKATAMALLKEFEADLLIHGHIHKAGIDNIGDEHYQRERVVLGDWHDDAGSLIIMNQTSLNLMPFL